MVTEVHKTIAVISREHEVTDNIPVLLSVSISHTQQDNTL